MKNLPVYTLILYILNLYVKHLKKKGLLKLRYNGIFSFSYYITELPKEEGQKMPKTFRDLTLKI